jgi:hypothetical protein
MTVGPARVVGLPPPTWALWSSLPPVAALTGPHGGRSLRYAAGRRRAHSGHVADRRKTAQPFHLSGKVLDRTPQRG